MSESPEVGHTTPWSPVDWVRKHLAHQIDRLPDFCARRGIDEMGELALRGVFEKAIADLDELPGDMPLGEALSAVHYGALDARDSILNPLSDQVE